ncbi:MAG: hypothetical protein Q8755_02990, partial [Candidatus Phytoplasma australasiaticum]|nr:hypothetical protein [Candidatus Phytoplasma australasiaticum]
VRFLEEVMPHPSAVLGQAQVDFVGSLIEVKIIPLVIPIILVGGIKTPTRDLLVILMDSNLFLIKIRSRVILIIIMQ